MQRQSKLNVDYRSYRSRACGYVREDQCRYHCSCDNRCMSVRAEPRVNIDETKDETRTSGVWT
jgi:hypothetical protein